MQLEPKCALQTLVHHLTNLQVGAKKRDVIFHFLCLMSYKTTPVPTLKKPETRQ